MIGDGKIMVCNSTMLRPDDRVRVREDSAPIPEWWPRITKTSRDGDVVHIWVDGIDFPLLMPPIVYCVWGSWNMDHRKDSNVRSSS